MQINVLKTTIKRFLKMRKILLLSKILSKLQNFRFVPNLTNLIMKPRFLLFALPILVGGILSIYLTQLQHPDNGIVQNYKMHCGPDFKTYQASKSATDPHAVPNDWMAMQRMYPYNSLNTEACLEAMREAAEMHAQTDVRLEWEPAGPTNIGGRITDIEVNPDNNDVIYIGAATGGILKTVDGGNEWENIFDDAAVISIGDIALDPANSNIIYVGTAEANAASYSFVGDGMHKSYDGGDTWQHIGLEQSAYIARIVVDHTNSQRVFVAACGNLFSTNSQRGIYRSDDGGENWDQVLFLTDSTAAIDLVQHPVDPDILYAAMWERVRGLNYRRSFGNSSGVWKTIDGGDTWTELTNGLPNGDEIGRIGLAIAKSNPEVVYAFYDNQDNVELYRTEDGGDLWFPTNHNDIHGMNSSFGWYFGQIRVNPNDEDQFWVLGVEMYRSDNGGNSYIPLAGYWNLDEIHVDHHALWIDENTETLFEGNDGGLYVSDNYGNSWDKINNLPITQFYAMDIDYNYPERIYGGTQDNNTIRTLTGDLDDWEAILGGDGMYTLVDYENPFLIYAESQWGNLARSSDLGYSFNWIGTPAAADIRTNWSSPYVLHPEDPSIMYFGTYRVWKGTESGWTWSVLSEDMTKGDDGSTFHTISTIAISKLDPDMILVGSDDGLVHITTNSGTTFIDISDGLPNRWITRVEFDPFEENTIYATVSGFRWEEAFPHVFKSLNLGEDWIDISSNLPQVPVNVIVCDPDLEDRYFIGTDAGMFCTEDGGNYWYGISCGMPNTPVVAMKIHEPTLTLVVATHGNSCFRIDLDDIINHTGENTLENTGEIKVFPNPVSDFATIDFEVPAPGNYDISIYTINGSRVTNLYDGQLTEDNHRFTWNVNNNAESIYPNGIYLLTITNGNKVWHKKIILYR